MRNFFNEFQTKVCSFTGSKFQEMDKIVDVSFISGLESSETEFDDIECVENLFNKTGNLTKMPRYY